MSDANSLLPCPFCGGDAEEMGGMLLARVGCVACDAAIDANTQKRANQRWNARQSAPPQTPAPQDAQAFVDKHGFVPTRMPGETIGVDPAVSAPMPAPQGEMAEPVGWLQIWRTGPASSPSIDVDYEHGPERPKCDGASYVPLYATQQGARHEGASPVSTGADAKDAARYRFLRNRGDEQFNGRTLVIALHHDDGTSHGLLYDAADAAIDAAMSDEAGKV